MPWARLAPARRSSPAAAQDRGHALRVVLERVGDGPRLVRRERLHRRRGRGRLGLLRRLLLPLVEQHERAVDVLDDLAGAARVEVRPHDDRDHLRVGGDAGDREEQLVRVAARGRVACQFGREHRRQRAVERVAVGVPAQRGKHLVAALRGAEQFGEPLVRLRRLRLELEEVFEVFECGRGFALRLERAGQVPAEAGGGERVVGLLGVGEQLRGRGERLRREVELRPLHEDVPEPLEGVRGFGVGFARRERARLDRLRAAVGDQLDRLAECGFGGGEFVGLLAQVREFAEDAHRFVRAVGDRRTFGREFGCGDRAAQVARVEQQPREQRGSVVVGGVFVEYLARELDSFGVAAELGVESSKLFQWFCRVGVLLGGGFELLGGGEQSLAAEVPHGCAVAGERVAVRLGHARHARLGGHAQYRPDEQTRDHDDPSASTRMIAAIAPRANAKNEPRPQGSGPPTFAVSGWPALLRSRLVPNAHRYFFQ